jgi:hypothetical protein
MFHLQLLDGWLGPLHEHDMIIIRLKKKENIFTLMLPKKHGVYLKHGFQKN